MTERRSIVAAVVVFALFLAACIAIYVTNTVHGDSYVVLSERAADAEEVAQMTKERVNINTATAEELCEIPGIGETRAAAIIEYREKNGPFLSEADIMQVKGIGESTYAGMADYITVGEGNE